MTITNMTTTMRPSDQTPAAAMDASALPTRADVVVIGGGLAGLTAAATAARAGRSVVLLDGASTLGGRARTRTDHGFALNIGPHALYRDGATLRILHDLGVQTRDVAVGYGGGLSAVKDGQLHGLPFGLGGLISTSLFGWRAKLEAATFLAGLAKLDPGPLDAVSVSDWLDSAIRTPGARQLVAVSIRTATYADDPARLSAGAGLRQLKAGLSGARYVDGGWQTLVDGLRARAEALGATVLSGVRAERVALSEDGRSVEAVQLTNGRRIEAGAVVLATPPRVASSLVAAGAQPALAHWADRAIPVRAATLDIGLRRLPEPDRWFALGFDQPLYFSVHSRWADLAPEGGAMVHVLRYLGADTRIPDAEAELEGLLDLMQPGWRAEVVTRRFLPEVTVAGALPSVAWEQADGPRGPAVPDTDGLFVAGDWVGPVGMLADRATSSGSKAGLAAASSVGSAGVGAGRAVSRVSVTIGAGGRA